MYLIRQLSRSRPIKLCSNLILRREKEKIGTAMRCGRRTLRFLNSFFQWETYKVESASLPVHTHTIYIRGIFR